MTLFYHHPNTQLFQLLQFNTIRRVNHHVPSLVVFREGNKIANGIGAIHHGIEAVKPKSNATVWWRTVLKCTQQETKLGLSLFLGKAQ